MAWLINAALALVFVLACDRLHWAWPLIAIGAVAFAALDANPALAGLRERRLPGWRDSWSLWRPLLLAGAAFWGAATGWAILLEPLLPAVAAGKLAIAADFEAQLLHEQQILVPIFFGLVALVGQALWAALRRLARDRDNAFHWVTLAVGPVAGIAAVVLAFAIPAGVVIGVYGAEQFLVSRQFGHLPVWLPFIVPAALASVTIWRGCLRDHPNWPGGAKLVETSLMAALPPG